MPRTDELDPDLLAAFQAVSSGDDAISVQSFHDPFFSLDPNAATLVTREQLAMALPMRRQMFSAAGARGTRLVDIDADHLDARHALVRTRWHVELSEPSDEPVTLESSYLMRRVGDQWQVIAYINHRDLAQLLGDREPTNTQPG